MKTMAAIGTLFAIVMLLAQPSEAQEFCGDRYCPDALVKANPSRTTTTFSARRHSSDGCPASLGCGCNLANYFHIAGRQWRKLWVARNWAGVGSPASKGCVDCVAVLRRGRGGHVGVVRRYDANGNPVIYSYANRRLGWTTTPYPARRVLAYRSL